MKKYEKIIICLFVVFTFLQLFDFAGASFLLVVSNFLLSLSYLIGGYWLLNTSNKENSKISILAGIVFGLALFFFWKQILIDTERYTDFFPIPNIIFCVVIAILLFVKRKQKDFVKQTKPIFTRSLVISLFTAFFFYIPIDFTPYTLVIYYLNAPREYLQHNLKIVEYNKKTETALKNEEYEKAIEYATKAEQNGRLWLGIPSNKILSDDGIVDTLFLQKYEIQKMNLIYNRLYRSYYSYALNNDNKIEALKNFKTAYQFLTVHNFQDGNWKEEEINSLTVIARTLSELDRNDEAIEKFNQAFAIAQSLGEKANENILFTYEEIGNYLQKNKLYEKSNQHYQFVIDGLLKDSLNAENRIELASLYRKTAINNQRSFNYEKALANLNQSFFYLSDESNDIYISALYQYALVKAHFYQYKDADSILSKCVFLYKITGEQRYSGNIALCNYTLHLVNMQLANYKKSEEYIKKSLAISEKKNGKISVLYRTYLASYANLNFVIGNYTEAKNQYKECLEINEKTKNDKSTQVGLLVQLALIDTKLYDLEGVEKYVNQIESIINQTDDLNIYDFINDWENLNYSVGKLQESENLFREVIEIDKENNASTDMSTGTALNGLALIYLEKKNYKLADSLFNDALEIYKPAFSGSHHSMATLHLNIASLYILQKKPRKADENIKIALQMNKDLFDENHLNFAEIHLVQADLALLNKNNQLQKQHLEKALSIFSKELEEDNIKIKDLKNQIKSIVL